MMGKNIVFASLLILSCSEIQYAGSSASGYRECGGCKITPERALELAAPYLDRTYELRLKSRHSVMAHPLTDTIVIMDGWYYVSRDNYPYKTLRAYIYHAVKVHTVTGEVIPPE